MNAAHYHLMINHIPLAGIICGTCLILVGLILKNEVLKKTALYFFVISAILLVPTYTTGGGAEKVLKAMMPGMTTDPVEQHEEMAMIALGGTGFLGLVSLVCIFIFWGQKPVKNAIAVVIAIISIAAIALTGYTAYLGGKIRHPEISVSTERK
jgi:uncharacterized membrane protein